MIKVFVIILNWNRKNLTLECIESVLKSKTKNMKIFPVIVDNGSTDGSLEVFKKLRKPCVVLKNKKNLGYSGGNNIGIKYALINGADCVVILNNDTAVEKNTFEILITHLFSDNKIGIAGPKILFSKNHNLIANIGGKIKKPRFFGVDIGCGEKDHEQFDRISEVDFVTGACLAVKKIVFEKIGIFDEKYFFYYEDADFCLRAKEEGFSSIVIPQAVIYHNVSSSVVQGSPLHHYYTTRNHLLFLEKHASFYLKARELLRTIKTIYELYNDNDKIRKKYSFLGIRDYFLRRFGERIYW